LERLGAKDASEGTQKPRRLGGIMGLAKNTVMFFQLFMYSQ